MVVWGSCAFHLFGLLFSLDFYKEDVIKKMLVVCKLEKATVLFNWKTSTVMSVEMSPLLDTFRVASGLVSTYFVHGAQ